MIKQDTVQLGSILSRDFRGRQESEMAREDRKVWFEVFASSRMKKRMKKWRATEKAFRERMYGTDT